jgi:hypothetical protein
MYCISRQLLRLGEHRSISCFAAQKHITRNHSFHLPVLANTITTSPGPQSNSQKQTPNQVNMAESFSNTQTGDKPADPYTQKNLDPTSLKEKVEDLLQFIDKTKFCMLTTQTAGSDLLASRCMALAAKVRILTFPIHWLHTPSHHETCLTTQSNRKATASISSSTPTPSPARPTI